MVTTLNELVAEMAAEQPVITVTDWALISLVFSFSDAWQAPLVGEWQDSAACQSRATFAAGLNRQLVRASLGLALHMQPRHFVYAAYFDVPVSAVQQFFLYAGQYEFILARPSLLTLTARGYVN